MITIDTDIHKRMRTIQDTEMGRPRISRSSNRNARPPIGAGRHGSLPTGDGLELKKETPQVEGNVKAPGANSFESHISRVINSV